MERQSAIKRRNQEKKSREEIKRRDEADDEEAKMMKKMANINWILKLISIFTEMDEMRWVEQHFRFFAAIGN